MKELNTILLCLAVLPAVALAQENTSGTEIPPTPRFPLANAERAGRAIAEHAERYDSGWVDEYLQARMTLYDANGDTVEREIRQMVLERDAGDYSMVRFMTPADIRGVGVLIHEHPRASDDTWLYLPATRRVRRIAGANRTASFQGTEFTYEDLAGIDVERYAWRFLRQTTARVDGGSANVYEVEARPTGDDTGYSRLVISYDREDFRTLGIVFFDRSGERLKTLTASGWQTLHGRFHRPRRLDMRNHQTGKRTLIRTTARFLNLALYPRRGGGQRDNLRMAQFTRRALEGG